MAVRPGPEPAAGDRAAVAVVTTPVLSVRRAPQALADLAARERLVVQLDGVSAALPEGGCLAVSVDGEAVHAADPDRPVKPASTLKLLTALAVLEHLPGRDRLITRVVAAAPPSGGVVDGHLWLVGGGDPLLATAAWAGRFPDRPGLRTPIEALADAVRDAGVREVRGAVWGDESRYDRQRAIPTWPNRYVVTGQAGPFSALTVDDGFAWPGGRAFTDPAAGAAEVLLRLLAEREVAVAGGSDSGRAPSEVHTVAEVASPPIEELVAQMLRESDNGTAELLVKELGRRVEGEGSTEAGLAVVRATVTRLGLPTEGLALRDGSGLDPGNRVTCRLLQGALAAAGANGPLAEGLAVAGRTGTLADRLRGEEVAGLVRAKTGTLRDVAALAGFAGRPDGPNAAFSLVVNGEDAVDDAFALQERLAATLLDHPRAPDLDELGPDGHPAAGG